MGTKFYKSIGLRIDTDEAQRVENITNKDVSLIDIFRAGIKYFERKLKKDA